MAKNDSDATPTEQFGALRDSSRPEDNDASPGKTGHGAGLRGSASNQGSPELRAADSNSNSADQRITRKKWPKDRAQRLEKMAAIMPQALMDYHGNTVRIAAALSVTPKDVSDVIEADVGLIEMQEIAENAVEALLVDTLIVKAQTSSSPVAAKFLLEKMFPDRWGKKSVATDTGKGFGAPTKDEPKSVLKKPN